MELRGLFPTTWLPGSMPPPDIIWVYANWLFQELDMMAEEKYPILKVIKGHRRLEIIEWLETQPDWTAGILNTKMEGP